MNIQLQYGTAVATVPAAALEVLDRATKNDLRVLLTICSDTSILAKGSLGECIEFLATRTGLPKTEIEFSLSFWRGTGILEIVEEKKTTENSLNVLVNTTVEPQEKADISDTKRAKDLPDNITVSRSKNQRIGEIPNYSWDQIEEFKRTQKDFSSNIAMCENAWRSQFTSEKHINIIMSLVQDYGYDWDFIIALLAHQASFFLKNGNQGKSLVTVYNQAREFHKEKIYTHDDLQKRFVEMEKMANFEKQIREWFDLGNSKFTPRQKQFLSTWLYEYHYDIEIVEMAYDISVDTKGTPNMAYTNGILKRWYENGLKTIEEIVANQEMQSNAIKEIREGNLTPDNCLEIINRTDSNDADDSGNSLGKNLGRNNISNDINIIRRLFGIGHRMLTKNEIETFTSWRVDLAFRYQIIYYAYELTIEKLNEYSLPYIDAIIRKWYEYKLTTMDAIKAYEKGCKEERQKKKKAKANTPDRESTFDVNDFFLDAVKRSFGDDFDPSILNS